MNKIPIKSCFHCSPNNYAPSFHHTWNYTQYYRPHAIPQLPPPRDIDLSKIDSEPEPDRGDDGEFINK